jgi:hypothetical protein
MARCYSRSLISVFVGSVVSTGLFGCDRAPSTIDDVVDRSSKAMGGRAAIEAVLSIEVSLHVTDPCFEADGVYYAARQGKMRIDISAAGKQVFTKVFDGQRGSRHGVRSRSLTFGGHR